MWVMLSCVNNSTAAPGNGVEKTSAVCVGAKGKRAGNVGAVVVQGGAVCGSARREE